MPRGRGYAGLTFVHWLWERWALLIDVSCMAVVQSLCPAGMHSSGVVVDGRARQRDLSGCGPIELWDVFLSQIPMVAASNEGWAKGRRQWREAGGATRREAFPRF